MITQARINELNSDYYMMSTPINMVFITWIYEHYINEYFNYNFYAPITPLGKSDLINKTLGYVGDNGNKQYNKTEDKTDTLTPFNVDFTDFNKWLNCMYTLEFGDNKFIMDNLIYTKKLLDIINKHVKYMCDNIYYKFIYVEYKNESE